MRKTLGAFVAADSTKCSGCKACELACFQVHNQKSNQVGHTAGTVKVPVIPKLYLTFGENACMPVQCKHCEDAPCLNICEKKAIQRIDFQIIVNGEKCIGCKDCMLACPFGAVTLVPLYKKGKQVQLNESSEMVKTANKCDLCKERAEGPACVQVCPNQALRLVDINEERKAKNRRTAENLMYTRVL